MTICDKLISAQIIHSPAIKPSRLRREQGESYVRGDLEK